METIFFVQRFEGYGHAMHVVFVSAHRTREGAEAVVDQFKAEIAWVEEETLQD